MRQHSPEHRPRLTSKMNPSGQEQRYDPGVLVQILPDGQGLAAHSFMSAKNENVLNVAPSLIFKFAC